MLKPELPDFLWLHLLDRRIFLVTFNFLEVLTLVLNKISSLLKHVNKANTLIVSFVSL